MTGALDPIPDGVPEGLGTDAIAVSVVAMKLEAGADVARVIRTSCIVSAGGGIEAERMRVMHAATLAGMKLGLKLARAGWREDPADAPADGKDGPP
jgi:hypothetical protein